MFAQLALIRRFFNETRSRNIQLGLVGAEALLSSVLVTAVPWTLGAFLNKMILEKSPSYDATTLALIFGATLLLFVFRLITQLIVRKTVRRNGLIVGASFLIRLRRHCATLGIHEVDQNLKSDLSRLLALPLSGFAPSLRFAATITCLSILSMALNQHILFEPFTTGTGTILAFFFFTLILSYTKALPDAFLTIELAAESAKRLFEFLDRSQVSTSTIARPAPKISATRESSDEIEAEFR